MVVGGSASRRPWAFRLGCLVGRQNKRSKFLVIKQICLSITKIERQIIDRERSDQKSKLSQEFIDSKQN